MNHLAPTTVLQPLADRPLLTFFRRKAAIPLSTRLRTFAFGLRPAWMASKRAHFERIGIAYMPTTIAGWICLFAFVILALGCVLVVQSLWAKAGWPGADLASFVTLTIWVIAITRFAHNRSA